MHRVKADIAPASHDLLSPPRHGCSLHWAASVLRVVANLLDQCATAQGEPRPEPSGEGRHESSGHESP